MAEFELNRTLKDIQQSAIRSFNDKISGIDGLIRLTLGEPDFPTPRFIKDAAIEAIDKSFNGYSHSRGEIELREIISDYMNRHYDVKYDPETEIIVTVGATEALFTSLYAILNPGDKVLVGAPYYAVYKNFVTLAGGEFVPVNLREDHFLFTPEKLDTILSNDPAIKVLFLNHPSNPTGATYNAEQLEGIAEVARKHNLIILSDEIYSELTYGDKHVSMAKFAPERTIVVNGASKSHSMTGWRMGFICAPEVFTSQIFKIHQAVVNAPSTQAQYACIEGYSERGDIEIDRMRNIYLERRNLIRDGMNRLGFETSNPQGAFYLFVKVPDWFDGDDMDFCLDLAHKAKVGVVPGSAFGEDGKGYFRISYAASTNELNEFLNRVETYIKETKD